MPTLQTLEHLSVICNVNIQEHFEESVKPIHRVEWDEIKITSVLIFFNYLSVIWHRINHRVLLVMIVFSHMQIIAVQNSVVKPKTKQLSLV